MRMRRVQAQPGSFPLLPVVRRGRPVPVPRRVPVVAALRQPVPRGWLLLLFFLLGRRVILRQVRPERVLEEIHEAIVHDDDGQLIRLVADGILHLHRELVQAA